jgi:hypothetical protein
MRNPQGFAAPWALARGSLDVAVLIGRALGATLVGLVAASFARARPSATTPAT